MRATSLERTCFKSLAAGVVIKRVILYKINYVINRSDLEENFSHKLELSDLAEKVILINQ